MIELQNVSFTYEPWEEEENTESGQSNNAVSHVSLEIAQGAFVALLGRNGSGKSSLARLLNGIELPDEGTIHVEGLTTHKPAEIPTIRRAVQIVFQNPENQQVGITVGEDIAFGLSNIGYPHAQLNNRIAWALQLVGLEAEVDRPVSALSGGEKQKLALASVLALSPRYLILDEATSMLDPVARRTFVQTLHEARRHQPFALIYITHHLEEVMEADQWFLFNKGELRSAGTPEELMGNSELLEACGLELPYMRQLSLALRRKGLSVPANLAMEELRHLLCKSS